MNLVEVTSVCRHIGGVSNAVEAVLTHDQPTGGLAELLRRNAPDEATGHQSGGEVDSDGPELSL